MGWTQYLLPIFFLGLIVWTHYILFVGDEREMVDYSGWISVEDKLPKVNGMYIVYAPDGNSPHGEGMWYENIVTLAEYAFGSWWWRENSNDFDITDIVTHWMPLPEPPRMEEE